MLEIFLFDKMGCYEAHRSRAAAGNLQEKGRAANNHDREQKRLDRDSRGEGRFYCQCKGLGIYVDHLEVKATKLN